MLPKKYPVYKVVKERLAGIAPCFMFLNQYVRGNDNTSYKVPALYIEFSNDLQEILWPGGIRTAKTWIKIHLITHAPYKNHDNEIQDSAIFMHENTLEQIDLLLNGWKIHLPGEKPRSQQFIPGIHSTLNFLKTNVFSVLHYDVELIYYRSIQS